MTSLSSNLRIWGLLTALLLVAAPLRWLPAACISLNQQRPAFAYPATLISNPSRLNVVHCPAWSTGPAPSRIPLVSFSFAASLLVPSPLVPAHIRGPCGSLNVLNVICPSVIQLAVPWLAAHRWPGLVAAEAAVAGVLDIYIHKHRFGRHLKLAEITVRDEGGSVLPITGAWSGIAPDEALARMYDGDPGTEGGTDGDEVNYVGFRLGAASTVGSVTLEGTRKRGLLVSLCAADGAVLQTLLCRTDGASNVLTVTAGAVAALTDSVALFSVSELTLRVREVRLIDGTGANVAGDCTLYGDFTAAEALDMVDGDFSNRGTATASGGALWLCTLSPPRDIRSVELEAYDSSTNGVLVFATDVDGRVARRFQQRPSGSGSKSYVFADAALCDGHTAPPCPFRRLSVIGGFDGPLSATEVALVDEAAAPVGGTVMGYASSPATTGGMELWRWWDGSTATPGRVQQSSDGTPWGMWLHNADVDAALVAGLAVAPDPALPASTAGACAVLFVQSTSAIQRVWVLPGTAVSLGVRAHVAATATTSRSATLSRSHTSTSSAPGTATATTVVTPSLSGALTSTATMQSTRTASSPATATRTSAATLSATVRASTTPSAAATHSASAVSTATGTALQTVTRTVRKTATKTALQTTTRTAPRTVTRTAPRTTTGTALQTATRTTPQTSTVSRKATHSVSGPSGTQTAASTLTGTGVRSWTATVDPTASVSRAGSPSRGTPSASASLSGLRPVTATPLLSASKSAAASATATSPLAPTASRVLSCTTSTSRALWPTQSRGSTWTRTHYHAPTTTATSTPTASTVSTSMPPRDKSATASASVHGPVPQGLRASPPQVALYVAARVPVAEVGGVEQRCVGDTALRCALGLPLWLVPVTSAGADEGAPEALRLPFAVHLSAGWAPPSVLCHAYPCLVSARLQPPASMLYGPTAAAGDVVAPRLTAVWPGGGNATVAAAALRIPRLWAPAVAAPAAVLPGRPFTVTVTLRNATDGQRARLAGRPVVVEVTTVGRAHLVSTTPAALSGRRGGPEAEVSVVLQDTGGPSEGNVGAASIAAIVDGRRGPSAAVALSSCGPAELRGPSTVVADGGPSTLLLRLSAAQAALWLGQRRAPAAASSVVCFVGDTEGALAHTDPCTASCTVVLPAAAAPNRKTVWLRFLAAPAAACTTTASCGTQLHTGLTWTAVLGSVQVVPAALPLLASLSPPRTTRADPRCGARPPVCLRVGSTGPMTFDAGFAFAAAASSSPATITGVSMRPRAVRLCLASSFATATLLNGTASVTVNVTVEGGRASVALAPAAPSAAGGAPGLPPLAAIVSVLSVVSGVPACLGSPHFLVNITVANGTALGVAPGVSIELDSSRTEEWSRRAPAVDQAKQLFRGTSTQCVVLGIGAVVSSLTVAARCTCAAFALATAVQSAAGVSAPTVPVTVLVSSGSSWRSVVVAEGAVAVPPLVVTAAVGCGGTAHPSTGYCPRDGAAVVTVHGYSLAALAGATLATSSPGPACVFSAGALRCPLPLPTALSGAPLALTSGTVRVAALRASVVLLPTLDAAWCPIGFYSAVCAACATRSCSLPPCSGHGTCDDSADGTGRCTCAGDPVAGYWAGGDCGTCAAGWHGPSCRGACPGVDVASPCAGHGTCVGVSGRGVCRCVEGFMVDPTGNCTQCGAGRFGAECAPCPGSDEGTVCNGHGSCFGTRSGNGTCLCAGGYSGADCSFPCTAGTCGEGTCGNNGCVCSAGWAQGALGSCTVCRSDRFGPTCASHCPACVHGACDSGTTASGTCRCHSGYWGALCATRCLVPECGGHGVCSQDTGRCVCFANATAGHWTGAGCSECHAAFNTTGCRTACPGLTVAGPSVAPCGGHGRCDDGRCICAAAPSADPLVPALPRCGAACELLGAQCHDPGCDAAVVCAGHGACLISGGCLCSTGWGGAACGTPHTCSPPCGAGYVCAAGHECLCPPGLWGQGCGSSCPGRAVLPSGAVEVCSGRGVCGPTGACDCPSAYVGAACELSCPLDQAGAVCSAHGVCAATGQCSCHHNFAGVDCGVCRAGWSGSECLVRCVHGASTPPSACVCDPGYAGPGCTASCPRETDVVCAGHGACNDGEAGTGRCACRAPWYGPACTRRCTPEGCALAHGLRHAMCSPAGACTCLQDGVRFFGGPLCDECAVGLWGAECNLPCRCSGHGSCTRTAGLCRCFHSDEQGRWGGATCDRCAAGYIGMGCVARALLMTPNAARDVEVALPSVPAEQSVAPGRQWAVAEGADHLALGSGPLIVVFRQALRNVSTPYGVPVTTARLQLAAVHRTGPACGTAPVISIGLRAADALQVRVTCLDGEHRLLSDGGSTSMARSVTAAAAAPTDAVLDSASGVRVLLRPGAGRVDVAWQHPTAAAPSVVAAMTHAVLVGSVQGGAWWAAASGAANGTAHAVLVRGDGHTILLTAHTHDEAGCGAGLLSCVEFLRCVPSAVSGGVAVGCVARRASHVLVAVAATVTLDGTVTAFHSAATVQGFQGAVCTALMAAPHATVAAVTISDGQPSVLLKWRPADAALTDARSLGWEGRTPLVARALHAGPSAGELTVAVTVGALQVRLLSLSLFSVGRSDPAVVDAAGGTPVALHGEGFDDAAQYWCRIGNTPAVRASIMSATEVRCVASTALQRGTACSSGPAQLLTGDLAATATNVLVPRPVAVTLTSENVSAVAVEDTAALWHVAFGPGLFHQGSAAAGRCRLRDARGIVGQGQVSILGHRRVACRMGALFRPTVPPAAMVFSHDGHVFAPSGAPFAVVGSPAGIALLRPRPDQEVAAGLRVTIPPIVAGIIDLHGNAVLGHQAPLVATATASGPALPALVVLGHTTLGADGQGSLRGASVARPGVGRLVITVSAKAGRWAASVALRVVSGAPSALRVLSSVALWRYSVRSSPLPLQPTPRVIVVDAAGNQVLDPALLPHRALLHFERVAARGRQYAVAADNVTIVLVEVLRGLEYRFPGVVLRGVHGVAYTLRFSVAAVYGITSALVSVPVAGCEPREWAVVGTTRCDTCPDHAVCDGSPALRPVPGAWRGAVSSTVFYECEHDLCPALGPQDTEPHCRDGHTGPLCTVCASEYGRATTKCHACPPAAVAWGLVSLMTAVAGVVLAVFVEVSLRAGRVRVIALLRITLTYLQLLTGAVLSSQTIPAAAQQSLETLQGIVALDITTVLFGCTFATSFYSLYVPVVLLLPAFCVVYGALSGAAVVVQFVRFRRAGGAAPDGFSLERMDGVLDAAPLPREVRQQVRLARADSLMMGVSSSDEETRTGTPPPSYPPGPRVSVDPVDVLVPSDPVSSDPSPLPEIPIPLTTATSLPGSCRIATRSLAEFDGSAVDGAVVDERAVDLGLGTPVTSEESTPGGLSTPGGRSPCGGLSGPLMGGSSPPGLISVTLPTEGLVSLAPEDPSTAVSSVGRRGLLHMSTPFANTPRSSGSRPHRSRQSSPVPAVAALGPDQSPMSVGAASTGSLFRVQPLTLEAPLEQHRLQPHHRPSASAARSLGRSLSRRVLIQALRSPDDDPLPQAQEPLPQEPQQPLVPLAQASTTAAPVATPIAAAAPATPVALPVFATKARPLRPIDMQARTGREAVLLWLERLVAAFFIAAFVLYPTVIKYSGKLFVCQDVDYGVLGQRSVLTVDMRLACSGRTFEVYRAVGALVLVAFGLGFPVGAMLLIVLFRHVSRNPRRTAQLFQFVVGGYEPHLWFWESVMMARKAAIAFANFGIADVTLRSYVMMWTIGLGFAADVTFVPFRSRRQQIVDALAMAAIAVSLNLVQLFPYADGGTVADRLWTWAIVLVAVLVNGTAIGAVFWAVSGSLKEMLLAAGLLPQWALPRSGPQGPADTDAARVLSEKLAACHPRLALVTRALALGPPALTASTVQVHEVLIQLLPGVVDASPSAASDLAWMYALERDMLELVLAAARRLRGPPKRPLVDFGSLKPGQISPADFGIETYLSDPISHSGFLDLQH